jgi:hypothetical protein
MIFFCVVGYLSARRNPCLETEHPVARQTTVLSSSGSAPPWARTPELIYKNVCVCVFSSTPDYLSLRTELMEFPARMTYILEIKKIRDVGLIQIFRAGFKSTHN